MPNAGGGVSAGNVIKVVKTTSILVIAVLKTSPLEGLVRFWRVSEDCLCL